MKPQVLVRMWDEKEFFVVDEDTTTDELLLALLEMKNGERIARGFLSKEWHEFVKNSPSHKRLKQKVRESSP